MQKQLTKHSAISYTDFLKSLEVGFLALVECKARIDRQQLSKSKDGLAVDARAAWKRVDNDAFDVRPEITIRAISKNKKDGALEIKAVYLVHLHGKPPINEAHIKRFVEADLRILIWPYFREFIASMSARMHIPPITLPITGGRKK